MDTRKSFYTFILAVVGAIVGMFSYQLFFRTPPEIVTVHENIAPAMRYASLAPATPVGGIDFTIAAEKSVNSVVHVKTRSKGSGNDYYSGNPLYDFFFGPRHYQQEQAPVMGSGSGVIISEDGYIVTNNHVIDKANEIEVVLNDRRSFVATLVGTDPTTDIALLKIDEKSLTFLSFGNSDDLKVGEWVLAVGNPFNLTSTVTAGIVSAKSRSINILSNRNQPMGIESFIQTDAAVNPGNSGGALVNTRGELVGVNTAIASQTGSYTGYSFAVPVGIVQKVVGDLKEYGEVQRALLGIQIQDVTSELAEKLDLEKIEGVYVAGVSESGAARAAGIKSGDVILSINDELVNSGPELQEKVSRYRPGEEISVVVKREGKKKQFPVLLRNVYGSTEIVKRAAVSTLLGGKFFAVSDELKRRLKIQNGIQVQSLQDGKLKESGVKDGFIILKANRVVITSLEQFNQVVRSVEGGLFLTGVYPNGRVVYYAINLE